MMNEFNYRGVKAAYSQDFQDDARAQYGLDIDKILMTAVDNILLCAGRQEIDMALAMQIKKQAVSDDEFVVQIKVNKVGLQH